MFSNLLQWLAADAAYPRWAICILIAAAFFILVIALFIAWFEWEARRDESEYHISSFRE